MNTKENKDQTDVLPSASTGITAALIYAMLFVALMVMMEKTITADNLGLPAVALFLIVSSFDYIERNSRKQFQQIIVVGSFLLAFTCAILMAFWIV